MQFLLNKADRFTNMLLAMEFGVAERKMQLDYFGENPIIGLLPFLQKKFNDKYLLLNPDVGTWCVLNEHEYRVFQNIIDAKSRERRLSITEVKSEMSDFLVMLYTRGIISINNEPFISDKIFEDGPISTSNPLFIIIPSEKCNFLCTYCFANADNSKKKTMPMETIDRIIEKIAEIDFSSCSIEFSGGEALLNFDFIKAALPRAREKLNAAGKNVEFVMQTNGSMISKEMVDFIKQNKLGIGISLDGNEETNDRTRKFADGSGTYKEIRKSIEYMHSEGVPIGIILVLSKNNKDDVVPLMEHFRGLGLSSIKMNPIYNMGRAQKDWSSLALEPETFLEAHKAYFDYVFNCEEPVAEANTQMLINNLSSLTRSYRCMISTCGAGTNHFTFTPDGEVYPCSRYRFDSGFCMGNIHDDISLKDLSDKNEKFICLKNRMVSKITECSSCIYRRFCEGGCSMDSYQYSGKWNSAHPWCTYYMGIYEELFKRICEDIYFVQKITSKVDIYNKDFFQ